jgi:DNA-binding MarR family transcriptional regulator
VRLIDRLEEGRLVRRTAGDDGRVTSVALTTSGRRAQAVTQARMELLEESLAALSPAERHQFGEIAGKILAGFIRPPGATR